jgi:hypothetical protein
MERRVKNGQMESIRTDELFRGFYPFPRGRVVLGRQRRESFDGRFHFVGDTGRFPEIRTAVNDSVADDRDFARAREDGRVPLNECLEKAQNTIAPGEVGRDNLSDRCVPALPPALDSHRGAAGCGPLDLPRPDRRRRIGRQFVAVDAIQAAFLTA